MADDAQRPHEPREGAADETERAVGAAGRAGELDEPAVDADAPIAASRPTRRRRATPWYRRGNVWLGIVVVTAAGAWVISGIAEDRLARVDTQPGSPAAQVWCEATGRAEGVGLFDPGRGPLPDAPVGAWVAAGRSGHAELVASAPGELRPDAQEVADAFEALVREQPLLAGASAGSPEVLDEAQRAEVVATVTDVQDDHTRALDRLDRASVELCQHPLAVWPLVPPAGPGPTG